MFFYKYIFAGGEYSIIVEIFFFLIIVRISFQCLKFITPTSFLQIFYVFSTLVFKFVIIFTTYSRQIVYIRPDSIQEYFLVLK